MLRSLINRPLGSGYGGLGALLQRQVPFDRLTLCAAESGGAGLRVLHAVAGEEGNSDVVGRMVPLDGSLAGQVFREQRWLRIDSLSALLDDLPEGRSNLVAEDARRARSAGMVAGLLFPLTVDPGQGPGGAPVPVGVCLLWSKKRSFRPEHEAVLAALQPALSAALRNDLLFVEMERRSLELRALERLARATRASLDLEKVIPASLDAALALLGLSSGGILLLRGDHLELVLQRNLQSQGPLRVAILQTGSTFGSTSGATSGSGDSPLRRSFVERRALLCEDVAQDPQLRAFFGLSQGRQGRRTWLLTIPLFAGEVNRGLVFACGYDTFPSTRAELERMATIGHWIGSAIDDAERHAAARELASANVFYRHLITHLHDAVIATDATGKIEEWTGGAETLTGWRRGEVLGQDMLTLLYGKRAPEVRQVIEKELDTHGLFRGESTILRKGGQAALWESVVAPIERAGKHPGERPGGHGWVGVHRDVGEVRKRAEQQRKEHQLEGLSNLAGGLAHDFNNSLGAVLLTALLVREAAATGDPARSEPAQIRADMDVIIAAARRGAALAGQLLAFSHGAPLNLSPLDLNEAIQQALHNFTQRQRSQPQRLSVHTALSANLPPVRGDREQLLRALFNLLQNAEEAMPQGGRLRVETHLLARERDGAALLTTVDGEADSAAASPSLSTAGDPLPAGNYVRVLLADDGPGIEQSVRARLFEPFVTTKPGAAGLGLAVVFGVVKAHGGGISVDSDPARRGATFLIDLPVVLLPDAPRHADLQGRHEPRLPAALPAGLLSALPAGLPPATGPSAHETPGAAPMLGRVLVVDDEPVLIRIAARILRSGGYRVDTASNGIDALSRYLGPGAYDLVVLDSTMPGMSGREVLDELLRRDPAVRVLVISGYSMDGGPAELLQEGARGFLPKPFTPQEFLHAISEALQDD